MSEPPGFIVKASCDGFTNMTTFALRNGFDELTVDVAEAFDLIPASVSLFSLHQGSKLMVLLASQEDLDVVQAETMEMGGHVITIEVSGIPARRSLDAFGAVAGMAATLSQIGYLYWMVTTSHAEFYRELTIWTIVIFTVLANLGGFAYLLDDETDKNHPFRLWVRPFSRRLLMLVMAPFTGDVLPCVACKACGLNAPVRASTRDDVIKWGILMMVVQDAGVLWLMLQMHTGVGALPLDGAPMACLALTAGSVLLNLPRRLAHFVLESCEAAFREKEELADEAKILFQASQKMTMKPATPSAGPKPSSRPPSPPPPPPPPKPPTPPPTSNGTNRSAKGKSPGPLPKPVKASKMFGKAASGKSLY